MISVDDAWKKRVRDRLRELDWKQGDLADKIGATGGAMTGIMKPGITQSRLIHRIHEVLGFEPPTDTQAIALERHSVRRITKAVSTLSEDDQQRVLNFAEMLAMSKSEK